MDKIEDYYIRIREQYCKLSQLKGYIFLHTSRKLVKRLYIFGCPRLQHQRYFLAHFVGSLLRRSLEANPTVFFIHVRSILVLCIWYVCRLSAFLPPCITAPSIYGLVVKTDVLAPLVAEGNGDGGVHCLSCSWATPKSTLLVSSVYKPGRMVPGTMPVTSGCNPTP